MKKQDYTAIVIIVLALAAIIVITYNFYKPSKRKTRNYAWVKTYEEGHVQPYDFGVFKALLKDKAGLDFEQIDEKLKDRMLRSQFIDSSTYVFIGRYCYLTSEEVDALLEFAHVGHEVVLIAEGLPDTLLQTLSYFAKPVSINRFDDYVVNVETNRLQSRVKNHRFNYRDFDHDTSSEIDWYYLDEDQQLDYFFGQTGNRYIRLGHINSKLNYAKFKIGNGFVYIHTSPVLFTNYALRNDSGYSYMDEVFSGIKLKHVLYDTYSMDYKQDSEEIQRKSDSPLSYILRQPALRWAWYLFLSATLLFFLFKAKRKQRIVPVLEQKRNTSVRFIETLSGLFYIDANHRQMAETRMSLFLFFLRNKLNISTHDISPDIIKLIALKSKVPEKEILRIFDYYKQVIKNEGMTIDSENLMEFYNRIDTFYQLFYIKK